MGRDEWKDCCGNAIYEFVEKYSDSESAPMITGMLIDIEEEREVMKIIKNFDYFKDKVKEAISKL